MSYKLRKINRECADWILSILDRDKTIEQDPVSRKFKRTVYKTKTFEQLEELSKVAHEDFTIDDIERAVRLLYKNDHINYRYEHNDYMASNVTCTVPGEDAFYDSYYLVENRKDRIESYEYITKWVMPFLSIIISFGALAIAMVVLIHTWNKK